MIIVVITFFLIIIYYASDIFVSLYTDISSKHPFGSRWLMLLIIINVALFAFTTIFYYIKLRTPGDIGPPGIIGLPGNEGHICTINTCK